MGRGDALPHGRRTELSAADAETVLAACFSVARKPPKCGPLHAGEGIQLCLASPSLSFTWLEHKASLLRINGSMQFPQRPLCVVALLTSVC